jgi:hypothetical protein
MRRSAWIIALTVCSTSAANAQPACPRGELPAYAHNDYRNARPLEDALSMGFRGVEVDLVLVDGVLRVGHDRRGRPMPCNWCWWVGPRRTRYAHR